jgi:hypothetical protein
MVTRCGNDLSHLVARLPPHGVVRAVADAVRAFSAGQLQDDITLVVRHFLLELSLSGVDICTFGLMRCGSGPPESRRVMVCDFR